MENYIIELISVAGTFIVAYLGFLWALKNVKKEKYFEERKQIYYELASILPIIDTCITQSDYLQDCQLGGTAENKIVIMEMKLHDAEDRLKIMQESQHTYNEMHEVEIEISNWEYRIKRHKEYLQEMGELHKKLEEFDKSEWVKVLRDNLRVELNGFLNMYKRAIEIINDTSGLEPYLDAFYSDYN